MLEEPALCKAVNCKRKEAKKYCPITCRETKDPQACKVADCSKHDAVSFCPKTCGNKRGNWYYNVLYKH